MILHDLVTMNSLGRLDSKAKIYFYSLSGRVTCINIQGVH
jgi:hypothetical protein